LGICQSPEPEFDNNLAQGCNGASRSTAGLPRTYAPPTGGGGSRDAGRDDMKGFVILPHRRVVERTFSWFGRNRRLVKDFENLAETLATFVTPPPLLAVNGCCGFGEGTFASTHGNGQVAPVPAVRASANEPPRSNRFGYPVSKLLLLRVDAVPFLTKALGPR
jgi:hypothetical protein